ncbi:hypothetical protein AUJ16_03620 [Candidatus Micrarchaeota archaeon CG1_02_60_51]|nr:MAG: hypothetical protein AUJ16_03620 [Candidatus Micrarchaeota archaeon CG1_02_60_51]PIO03129.1 MAG: hypothetical protein COT57_01005 [Candidatus Micrarchaeota archaeon CG09_land_8_20_14_0_10_55_25]
MGLHEYAVKSFAESSRNRSDAYRKRVSAWRKGKTIQRVEKPLNPLRARELGYKAKKGFFVIRVRTKRGKRVRNSADLGRKPGKNRKRENPGKPWKWFAERKALRSHKNAELIGSYLAGEDGVYKFFEVLMRTKQ